MRCHLTCKRTLSDQLALSMEMVSLALRLSFKTSVLGLPSSGSMRLSCWTNSLAWHIVLRGYRYRGHQIRLGAFSSLAAFMGKQVNHCCNSYFLRSSGVWHLVLYRAGERLAWEPACKSCKMHIFQSTTGHTVLMRAGCISPVTLPNLSKQVVLYCSDHAACYK